MLTRPLASVYQHRLETVGTTIQAVSLYHSVWARRDTRINNIYELKMFYIRGIDVIRIRQLRLLHSEKNIFFKIWVNQEECNRFIEGTVYDRRKR